MCVTLCVFLCSLPDVKAKEYRTVEDLNQQAMEDVMRIRDEMNAMFNAPPPKIDYEKYDVYTDFKNVFSGYDNSEQWNWMIYENRSPWVQEKKEWHKKVFDKKKYDFIVLPVEDFSVGNDIVSRKLAADLIGAKIAHVTGQTVMPAELVLGYYGERAFVFEDYRLTAYERNNKVTTVHLLLKSVDRRVQDKHGFPAKELALVITKAGKVEKFKIYKLDEVCVQKTLEVQIIDKMDDMIQFITPLDRSLVIRTDPKAEKNWKLNTTVHETIDGIKDPIDSAAWLQFIACITPNIHQDAKDRLFERSVAVLTGVDKDSKYYRLFMARAMQYLHRRPLALPYLEGEKDMAMTGLQAYINGNYYELKETLGKITNPLLYAVSYLELLKLSRAYGKPVPEFDEKIAAGGWRQIIQYAIDDEDLWANIDGQKLFSSLGGIFPQFKSLLGEELQDEWDFGNHAGEDIGKNILNDLIYKIKERIVQSDLSVYENNLSETDFWLLYRNILINIPLKPLYRMVYAQGAYNSGVKYGEQLEPVFNGLTAFDAPYAQSLYKYALQNKSSTQKFYLEKAYKIACNIKQTSYKFEIDYRRTAHLIKKIPPLFKQGKMVCGYQGNPRGFFPADQINEQFTTVNFALLKSAYLSGKLSEKDFEQQCSKRFNGSPQKIIFSAQEFENKGERAKAIKLLQSAIRKDDQGWNVYNLLGEYFIENKEYLKATQVYASFPYFLNVPNGKRVETSNLAYEAGKVFDRAGRLQEAEYFYKFCVSFGTGAQCEMESSYRLAMMDKDYHGAARHAYSSWVRYDSLYSFGNFLSIMSMLGGSEDVRRLFKKTLYQYDKLKNTDGLWGSLFIDHRLGKADIDMIEKDLKDLMPVSASTDLKRQQRKYLFSQLYIDRELAVGNAMRIYQYNTVKTGDRITKPKEVGTIFSILSECPENLCDEQIKALSGMDMSDEYAHGYLGLNYILNKEYEKATQIFLFYDSKFNLLKSTFFPGFFLPYATMGFIQHTEATPEMLEQFKKILEPKEGRSTNFQRSLALALISAYGRDKKMALKYLTDASDKRDSNYAKSRSPSPWYQLISTAQWLYDYTGDKDFLLFGLKWARRHQDIYPQTAWAYAFEARYSEDSQARVRAAGFAHYLDPGSLWLSQIPEQIRSQGVQWWEQQDILKEKKQIKENLQEF